MRLTMVLAASTTTSANHQIFPVPASSRYAIRLKAVRQVSGKGKLPGGKRPSSGHSRISSQCQRHLSAGA